MKNLIMSLLIFVSLSSVAYAVNVPSEYYQEGISCMQTQTNDGFLPQNLMVYISKPGQPASLFIKFYIDNDLRYVVAQETSRANNMIQYKNVRLFNEDNGQVVGGHMGITFDADLSVFQSTGNFYWTYFDGGQAIYSCFMH